MVLIAMRGDLLTLTRFRLAVVGMVCLGRCDSLCALHHRRTIRHVNLRSFWYRVHKNSKLIRLQIPARFGEI